MEEKFNNFFFDIIGVLFGVGYLPHMHGYMQLLTHPIKPPKPKV